MNLKKYNLIQDSAGIMMGYYIGTIWAESYHHVGNCTVFMIGANPVAALNFVKVEECGPSV